MLLSIYRYISKQGTALQHLVPIPKDYYSWIKIVKASMCTDHCLLSVSIWKCPMTCPQKLISTLSVNEDLWKTRLTLQILASP